MGSNNKKQQPVLGRPLLHALRCKFWCLSPRACLAFRLTAVCVRITFKLLHQLLGMFQVLFREGSRFLCDLGHLPLSLLLDHLQRSDHLHMGHNCRSHEALVELDTRLLLKLVTRRLCLPLDKLTIDLHKLLNCIAASRRALFQPVSA